MIRIAREQGGRTFALQAAVPLAKLYQSTGRLVEAHAALSDALDGFPIPSPERGERALIPEFPAFAEAQALLAALAAADAVKAQAARRETRSKLHTGYALATMMTKGFGADATQAALARAASASGAARPLETWTIAYGRVSADLTRGDASAARAGAEAFVAEAEAAALPAQAAFGRRMLGFIKFIDGDLAGARADLSRALADFDERRDGALQTAFAVDHRAHAFAYLSQTVWLLGQFDEADRLLGEALAHAKASGQPASITAGSTAPVCSARSGETLAPPSMRPGKSARSPIGTT